MKVLVCGGRAFPNASQVNEQLELLHNKTPISLLINGGAQGADYLSTLWAKHRGIPVQVFEAEWRVFGRAAGPKRNQRMIEKGKPDLVLAFPGGSGTADMVRRARVAGISVMDG